MPDNINQEKLVAEVIYLFHIMFFEQSSGHTVFALPEEQRVSLSVYGLEPDQHINIDAVLVSAREAASHNGLKHRLCAALKSASKDVSDIAKVVVGVCLPLSLGGHAAIPLSPLIYAGISMIIFNAGIGGFCSETEERK